MKQSSRSPITSVRRLEEFGRRRLSKSFYMRDFLYSEISAIHGIPNLPQDPERAVAAGEQLCRQLLEPLNATFGRIAVRSAYRSPAVNQFGNENNFSCSTNARTAASHIWDLLDERGCMGATASVVIPWFADRYENGADWRGLAWWIHDHLPYGSLYFFPKLAAFNIQWHEQPKRRVDSYIKPRGTLTKPGMANHTGSHASWYEGFPKLKPG